MALRNALCASMTPVNLFLLLLVPQIYLPSPNHTLFLSLPGGGYRCKAPNCSKLAQGSGGKCVSHGGTSRNSKLKLKQWVACAFVGCTNQVTTATKGSKKHCPLHSADEIATIATSKNDAAAVAAESAAAVATTTMGAEGERNGEGGVI